MMPYLNLGRSTSIITCPTSSDYDVGERVVISVPTLEEKLSWQKKQRELESKRSKLRRELFDRLDEVDAQRSQLIEALENQLQQQVEERTLFTIEWELQ